MENRITLCSNCMAIKDKDSQGNELWKSVNCGIASDTCPEEIGILTAPYNQLLTDYRYKISHGYCPPCTKNLNDEMSKITPQGNKKRITLAYDLDGTLYDTLNRIFKVDQGIRNELGYKPITKDFYVANFQSRDWNKFYTDLGIKEEDVPKAIKLFIEKFKDAEAPYLIPDAKDAIERSERILGHENVFIITNEPLKGVKKRFERDGLNRYLDRVRTPYQGKAKELYELATQNGNSEFPFVYVGDLVSDGEDCRDARERGAENLRFYGLVHEYSMNSPQRMKAFVERNSDFAKTLNNLREVNRVWKGI